MPIPVYVKFVQISDEEYSETLSLINMSVTCAVTAQN